MTRFRKGVRLKAEFQSPIRYTTEARGLVALSRPKALYSGECALPESEKRQQAAMMAIAEAQPHRGAVFDDLGHLVVKSGDRRLGTAIGRFCAYHKPMALSDWMEDAGNEYAAVIYRYRRAMGFACFANSGDLPPGKEEDEEKRRDKAEMDKRGIDNALLHVHPNGPAWLEAVCFHEINPPLAWTKPLVACLLVAADHFGLTPQNARDEQ